MAGATVRCTPDRDGWTIDAPPLSLTFRLEGGRWTHDLRVASAGGHGVFAGSIEGDHDRDDPRRVVSPAYQEIHEQSKPGSAMLLLTGQSTPHIFSAVVTATSHPGEIRLDFDVADRCRSAVDAFAATYRIEATAGDLVRGGLDGLRWSLPDWAGGEIAFLPGDDSQTTLAESGRHGSMAQCLGTIKADQYTHRLRYAWTWRAAPGQSC